MQAISLKLAELLASDEQKMALCNGLFHRPKLCNDDCSVSVPACSSPTQANGLPCLLQVARAGQASTRRAACSTKGLVILTHVLPRQCLVPSTASW